MKEIKACCAARPCANEKSGTIAVIDIGKDHAVTEIR